jgi:uncharacterized membrane protein YbhN (UPF0104 family)
MALVKSSLLRWAIRAAVSGIVLAVLLTIIPLHAVIDALRRISVWTWSASVLVFFAGHYLNALKLRLLIGTGAAPVSACVRAQYAGLVANLGLPGLAGGDLVRAAYLAPTVGTKRVALASVADRLIDTATVVVLIAVALPLAGVPPALAGVVSRAAWWVMGSAGAAAVAAAALFALRRTAISKKVTQAREALHARRFAVAGAVAISFSVQSAFVLTNVWLARQVGVQTPLPAWFVAWPMSKLIAVLPISLGGIGVREAALVSLLVPYGAPREAVLASGILWQAVLAVTGLIGLIVTQMLPRLSPVPAALESPAKQL